MNSLHKNTRKYNYIQRETAEIHNNYM